MYSNFLDSYLVIYEAALITNRFSQLRICFNLGSIDLALGFHQLPILIFISIN